MLIFFSATTNLRFEAKWQIFTLMQKRFKHIVSNTAFIIGFISKPRIACVKYSGHIVGVNGEKI